MDKRTGTIITAVTALLCGCPGLCLLIFGGFLAAGGSIENPEQYGITTTGDPLTVGILFLCLGVVLAAIPVAVGGFTFWRRPKPSPEVVDENIPPAI
jgi:hypothetical protein